MTPVSQGPLGELAPSKGLIFRLTHIHNVPFILRNGLHCSRSEVLDPDFTAIGLSGLIDRRAQRTVPQEPGGTLADYVPFYFTPCSPMMYKITTGHGGVVRRSRSELVVVVSSIHRLAECEVRYLITDRHAVLNTAQFSSDPSAIDALDWERLQARNFQRDPMDPGRFERYEAECLAHRHVPVEALIGLACSDAPAQNSLEAAVADCGLKLPVAVRSHWFIG